MKTNRQLASVREWIRNEQSSTRSPPRRTLAKEGKDEFKSRSTMVQYQSAPVGWLSVEQVLDCHHGSPCATFSLLQRREGDQTKNSEASTAETSRKEPE